MQWQKCGSKRMLSNYSSITQRKVGRSRGWCEKTLYNSQVGDVFYMFHPPNITVVLSILLSSRSPETDPFFVIVGSENDPFWFCIRIHSGSRSDHIPFQFRFPYAVSQYIICHYSSNKRSHSSLCQVIHHVANSVLRPHIWCGSPVKPTIHLLSNWRERKKCWRNERNEKCIDGIS